MKIILLTILCFVFCFGLNAQSFPIKQNIGNANTNVQGPGTISTLNGFTWATNYADTTAANAVSFVKFTPGITIRTNDTLFWVRNDAINRWVPIGSGGASIDLANMGLTKSGSNIQFGQDIGAASDPALISFPREIPAFGNGITNYVQFRTQTGSNKVKIYPFGVMTLQSPLFAGFALYIQPGTGTAISNLGWNRGVEGSSVTLGGIGLHYQGGAFGHFFTDMRDSVTYTAIEVGGVSHTNFVGTSFGGGGITQLGLLGKVVVGAPLAHTSIFGDFDNIGSTYLRDSLTLKYTPFGTVDSILAKDANDLVIAVPLSAISTNIYNTDGSLTANRTLSLNAKTLLMSSGSAFSSTAMYLDPTAGAEQALLEAYNTTAGDNTAYVYANTSNTAAQTVLNSTFNASTKAASIELDATAASGSITILANDGIAATGGTIDIRATGTSWLMRTSTRAIDLTDSTYVYPLPRSNDTTKYKIVGRSSTGGLVDLNWGNSGSATTWNGIANPTGDQALTFDLGESSTWTNSNTTEDLFTINSSSITTSSFLSLNSTSTALAAGNNLVELVMSGANGTNAITANPLRISVTNTNATSGSNYGITIAASGATTSNRAIDITAGDIYQTGGGQKLTGAFSKTPTGDGYEGDWTSGTNTWNFVVYRRTASAYGNLIVSSLTEQHTSGSGGTNTMLLANGRAFFGGSTSPTALVHIGAGTATASTAPLKFVTGTSLTVAEAGAMEYTTPQLFFTNGGGQRQELFQGQQSRVSTQFDKTDQTLANITGLTATLVASGVYRFRAELYTTSDVTGGIKIAIGGTATATSIVYDGFITDAGVTTQARSTTIGGSGGAVTAVVAAHCTITGTIVVANAGSLTVQSARNAASGTTSVLVGSTFVVTQML